MSLSKIEESSLNLLANSENVKKALNANNGAPIYACRAWVNFNGTGTVAIRASGNVSSITDNGTGQYTLNFTNALPDNNYAPNITGGSGTEFGVDDAARAFRPIANGFNTTSYRFGVVNTANTAFEDINVACVSISR